MTRRGSLICFPGVFLGLPLVVEEARKDDYELVVIVEDHTPGLTKEQAEQQFASFVEVYGRNNSVEIRQNGRVVKRKTGK